MKVFLAGDSIVQDYAREAFIAGWGQYLPLFLKETPVVNFAKGGRSTRLFINEGRFDRLYQEVSTGDYVLIEFCHNDDATKAYKTMFNRLTPLGMPDGAGRYPIIPGERTAKNVLPQEYLDALDADAHIKDKQAVLTAVYGMLAEYPSDEYFPYSADGSKGTYKWFLKQYVDAARERSAVPVFVTAPARTVFDDNGNIKDGPGLHGGSNFAYIRAMRQLAEEMAVPVLDLFSYSCRVYEQIGPDKVHFLTSVKSGVNQGKWPEDFNKAVKDPETISEDTHFNKYGAFLMAKALAALIYESQQQLDDKRNQQLSGLADALTAQMDCISEKKPEGLISLTI